MSFRNNRNNLIQLLRHSLANSEIVRKSADVQKEVTHCNCKRERWGFSSIMHLPGLRNQQLSNLFDKSVLQSLLNALYRMFLHVSIHCST